MGFSRFTRWATYSFVVSIAIGTRFLIHQFTPAFSEYSSLFIYLSDAPLVLLAGWYLLRKLKTEGLPSLATRSRGGKLKTNSIIAIPAAIFLLLSIVSIFSAESRGLALYSSIRLFLLVLAALAVSELARDSKIFHGIAMILVVVTVLESLIGIAQFAKQGAVGLGRFGESPISATDSATARVLVETSKVVRAYGTFPHPNVLGEFLVFGLSGLVYLWLSVPKPQLDFQRKSYGENFRLYLPTMLTFLLLSSSLFIIVLGITLTFSRTAWVMGGGSLLFTVPYFLCTTPHLRRTAFTLFATFLVSVGFAFCILKPFVLPRAAVRAAEPSVTERVQYLKLGFGIIHERPQGVGMGNQVLYAQNYGLYGAYGIVRGAGQPVHNTYLLVADEVGFFGGVAFALILIGTLWRGIRWGALSLERATSLVMLGGVLASGLVDHFPWTLEQGRLLFTLALGIVVAQSKRP